MLELTVRTLRILIAQRIVNRYCYLSSDLFQKFDVLLVISIPRCIAETDRA